MHPRVKELVARAPDLPGVYIMKDAQQRILYIGKATRLRERLAAYTVPGRDERPTVAIFVPKIRDIEWIVTDSEKEAFLLENRLIKSQHPKYNVDWRDDKTYVRLALTPHPYPRLYITREESRPGVTYFGPFSSAKDVRGTLRFIQRLFLIRDCTDRFFSQRKRPCLRYQIKRCSAPCVGRVTPEAYRQDVEAAALVLKGQSQDVIKELREQMQLAAQALRYEEASQIRDRLRAIEGTLEPQHVEQVGRMRDMDAIACVGDTQATLVQVLEMRDGRMTGTFTKLLETPLCSEEGGSAGQAAMEESLRSFLLAYYVDGLSSPTYRRHPRTILLPVPLADQTLLEEVLSEHLGARLRCHTPQRGRMKRFLDLASKNAMLGLAEHKRKSEATTRLLSDLQKTLRLRRLPHRIEGYDISNIQGEHAVASQVVFTHGEPDKRQYRHYGIRTVEGANDFAMLREALLRRFQKCAPNKEEGYSSARVNTLPDLVLIDGGRGQLRQAVDVLTQLGLTSVEALGLAKDRGPGRPERIFLPNQSNPIVLPPSSPVLHLLMRVRDEAHRFGLSHHRKKRAKSLLHTRLTHIPGVGELRAKSLLRHLGSVARIRESTLQDLSSAPGMNARVAKAVYDAFHPSGYEEE